MLRIVVQLPARYSTRTDVENPSHPVGLRSKVRMAVEASDGDRNIAGGNSKVDEAISPLAKASVIEVEVAGEQGRTTKSRQESKNLIVQHPRAANVAADLSSWDATIAQYLPLSR